MAAQHPETLLKDYISAYHATAESLFTFRRVFTSQLGVVSALQVALHMEPADPATLLFNRRNGHVAMLEMKTNVPPSGALANLIDQPGGVPFRLTRNMKALLPPLCIKDRKSVV